MMFYLYIPLVLTALLTGCGQGSSSSSPTPGALQSANGQPLPAKLLDTLINDGANKPYRFQVFVNSGTFKLEGNKYEQEVYLQDFVDGIPSRRWRWKEFGTCTPSGEKLLCESGYIQNYRLELTQQGNTLVTRQNFTDPALEGSYVFGK
ncbi:MAG: hypothetical protein SFU83_18700 [Meiothermus sp.]|nr:hypothetical protein [Meiothermus sp.]